MINISTFKANITPKLHGASLAKVSAIYSKLHEASGNFLAMVKPYTVIRRARIENAIHDKVYNYTCEDDLEVNNILDIRPIGERSTNDDIEGSFGKQFDIKKKFDTCYVEYINGVKTLRLSKQLTPRTLLASMDSLTIGQTVTGSGDVTGLDLDYLDYVTGLASVKFNLSGSTGQGIITIDLPFTVDLSTLEDIGALFSWFKFPLASALTSVRLRVGSSSANYMEQTVTAAHDRAFESDAWMLLKEAFSSASETGTVDWSAIDYIQIAINYTAGTARSNVKLGAITASLGKAYEVVYYTNRLFTDSTSTTWKEIPTAETDLIRLEGATDLNAFMYEFMLTLQQELKGKNMTADFNFFKGKLGKGEEGDGGLYSALKMKYPDQTIARSIDYYNFASLDGDGGNFEDEE